MLREGGTLAPFSFSGLRLERRSQFKSNDFSRRGALQHGLQFARCRAATLTRNSLRIADRLAARQSGPDTSLTESEKRQAVAIGKHLI